MYYVVEGIDGSYKSTICEKLTATMNAAGIETFPVRQPGNTPLSEQFRTLVKEGHPDEEMTLYAESMLFLGARSQLFEHIIEPALKEGQSIVSDRCNLSTIAYQSFKGMDENYLAGLITGAPWFRKADFLVVIDVPVSVAESRIAERGEPSDRLELRLNHCAEVYRNFDASRLAKNVIRINGIDEDGNELTSDQITAIAFEKINDQLRKELLV